ncbi:unnamed protein product [Prorocentrum cordatum]|uniref:TauD/TfdA-like domain-containing protein n=1 Tax=Prorocentrum cordatum TaxID=2364126 RepID=A0ABN9RXU5_9DINO|nr:unnamed protein product [Polarella glacialis]
MQAISSIGHSSKKKKRHEHKLLALRAGFLDLRWPPQRRLWRRPWRAPRAREGVWRRSKKSARSAKNLCSWRFFFFWISSIAHGISAAGSLGPTSTGSDALLDYSALKESLRTRGHVRVPLGAGASPEVAERIARALTHCEAGGGQYNAGGGVHRGSLEGSAFLDAAEGAPASLRIQPHNEMAYSSRFPECVSFFMMQSRVLSGGLTELYDNLKLTRRLAETAEGALVLAKMTALGIQYVRLLHDEADRKRPGFYASWETSFSVDDFDEALRKANSSKDSFALACDDACCEKYVSLGMPAPRMQVVTWAPSMVTHPNLGEIVFTSVLNRHASWLDGHEVFDRLPYTARPYHCRWGDGAELTKREVDVIRSAYDDCKMQLKLQSGDLIVLDNLYVSHGRAPFVPGPERRLMGLLIGNMMEREESRSMPPPEYVIAKEHAQGIASRPDIIVAS